MKPEQLQEIEQRWGGIPKLHLNGWSVIDERNNIITTGSHWGNNFATIVIKNYAQLFAESPEVIQALLAEVKRLQERLQYEETCHAEAVQEVKRLNRMVDCSIWWHENCSDCDVCHRKLDCSLLGCGNAWRKYLESEVADNG